MMTRDNIDCFDWADIAQQSRDLAAKITIPVDIIVAVLRGGAVPATILANELDIECVLSVKICQTGQTVGVSSARGSTPYIGHPAEVLVPLNDVSLTGKNVLLVDDVMDSGETLVRVRDDVLARGAAVAQIATLHTKTYSKVRPDYWVQELTNWVFYPWMSTREFEAMRQSLQRRQQTQQVSP